MPASEKVHLHLISDSTGETVHALARAALAPFARADEVEIHLSVLVRSSRDVDAALAAIRAQPGPVWFTVVESTLRRRIAACCNELSLPVADVLDPMITALAGLFGEGPTGRPGLQHRMTTSYFDRVAALDYAISHDDGAHDSSRLGQRLRQADVILTGISRTSKTPTCIYLAYRGVKAANIPLIPNRTPPQALFDAMAAGVPVIGLTASPARLAHVRRQRLESLGQPETAGYADVDRIRIEVADARLFFQRHRLPVIDVTRRSIEETAAEILAALRSRPGRADQAEARNPAGAA